MQRDLQLFSGPGTPLAESCVDHTERGRRGQMWTTQLPIRVIMDGLDAKREVRRCLRQQARVGSRSAPYGVGQGGETIRK